MLRTLGIGKRAFIEAQREGSMTLRVEVKPGRCGAGGESLGEFDGTVPHKDAL